MNEIEFLRNSFNVNELVEFSFNKYKPYIYRRAYICRKISDNFIDIDDFLQETYLQLFYFCSKIDKNKISENFSFYAYVHFATCRIFKQIKKSCELIEFEYNPYYFDFMNNVFSCDQIRKKLSERQLNIFVFKINFKNEESILKQLKISHGTYNKELQEISKLFKKLMN